MWTTTLIVLFVILVLIVLYFVFSIIFYGKNCEDPLKGPQERDWDDTEDFWHKNTTYKRLVEITDDDIAIIEKLHDYLLDSNTLPLNDSKMVDARQLCSRFYKALVVR